MEAKKTNQAKYIATKFSTYDKKTELETPSTLDITAYVNEIAYDNAKGKGTFHTISLKINGVYHKASLNKPLTSAQWEAQLALNKMTPDQKTALVAKA